MSPTLFRAAYVIEASDMDPNIPVVTHIGYSEAETAVSKEEQAADAMIRSKQTQALVKALGAGIHSRGSVNKAVAGRDSFPKDLRADRPESRKILQRWVRASAPWTVRHTASRRCSEMMHQPVLRSGSSRSAMDDFSGSVAGQLPRKQSNVFCFQYVTSWQWQAVAGRCHARKGLKTKRKSVVVADAWQGSTNVLSAALFPHAEA